MKAAEKFMATLNRIRRILNEKGQITNPKLQISNKSQITNINIKSQTNKIITFVW